MHFTPESQWMNPKYEYLPLRLFEDMLVLFSFECIIYFHSNRCTVYFSKAKGHSLANVVQDIVDYGLDRFLKMSAVLTVCPSVIHLNTQVDWVPLLTIVCLCSHVDYLNSAFSSFAQSWASLLYSSGTFLFTECKGIQ